MRWADAAEAERLLELVLAAAGERLCRLDDLLARTAVSIAAEHDLTVYDAAYVACARRFGWRLVSTDLVDLVRPGLAESPHDMVARS